MQQPPKWEDVAQSDRYRSLSPEEQERVGREWLLMAHRYAVDSGVRDYRPEDLIASAQQAGIVRTGLSTADAFKEFPKSLVRGTARIAEIGAGAIQVLPEKPEYGLGVQAGALVARNMGIDQKLQGISNAGQAAAPVNPQLLQEWQQAGKWGKAASPLWWSTQIGENLPMMAALLVPGVGAGNALAATAARAGLGVAAQGAAATAGATAVSAPLEAMAEAAGTHAEVLARGGTRDQANSAAAEAYQRNVAMLAASQALSFGAGFAAKGIIGALEKSGLPTIRRALAKGATAATAGAVGVATQPEEEVRQNEISRNAVARVFGEEVSRRGMLTPRVIGALAGDNQEDRDAALVSLALGLAEPAAAMVERKSPRDGSQPMPTVTEEDRTARERKFHDDQRGVWNHYEYSDDQAGAVAISRIAAAKRRAATGDQSPASPADDEAYIQVAPKSAIAKTAAEGARLLGLNPVFVVPSRPEYNTFNGSQDGRTIYLNPLKGGDPLLTTVWHEFSHWLEDVDPDTYGKVSQAVLKGATGEGRAAYDVRRTASGKGSEILDQAALDQEFVSDVIGDLAGTPEWYTKLGLKEQGAAAKFADHVIRFLNKVIARFKQGLRGSREASRAIADLEGLRDTIAPMIGESINRRAAEPGAKPPALPQTPPPLPGSSSLSEDQVTAAIATHKGAGVAEVSPGTTMRDVEPGQVWKVGTFYTSGHKKLDIMRGGEFVGYLDRSNRFHYGSPGTQPAPSGASAGQAGKPAETVNPQSAAQPRATGQPTEAPSSTRPAATPEPAPKRPAQTKVVVNERKRDARQELKANISMRGLSPSEIASIPPAFRAKPNDAAYSWDTALEYLKSQNLATPDANSVGDLSQALSGRNVRHEQTEPDWEAMAKAAEEEKTTPAEEAPTGTEAPFSPRGELWIQDGRPVDAGEGGGHVKVVLDQLRAVAADILDMKPEAITPAILKAKTPVLLASGMDPRQLSALTTATANEDPRQVAMRELGWVRVAGTNVEMYRADRDTMEQAADGLRRAYGETILAQNLTIETHSPQRFYSDVPYAVLQDGNPAALRQYAARYSPRSPVARMVAIAKDQDAPVARPDLARQTHTAPAQAVQNAVDQIRTDLGEPSPEKVADWDRQARVWIGKIGGYETAAREIVSGRVNLSDRSMARAAIATMDELNPTAFKTGDPAKLSLIYELNAAFRQFGHEFGQSLRALRTERNALGGSVKRTTAAINGMFLDLPKDVKQAIAKATKDMTPEQRIEYVKKHMAKLAAQRAAIATELKAKHGIDIDNLTEKDVGNIDTLATIKRVIETHRSGYDSKAMEWWYNWGLLSAPITHLRNVVGNTGNILVEATAQRLAEATIATAMRGVGVQMDKAATFGEFKTLLDVMGRHMLRTVGAAWKAGEQAFRTEVPARDTRMEIGTKGAAVKGNLGRFARIPGRLLLLEDSFGYSIAHTVWSQAYAYRYVANELGIKPSNSKAFAQAMRTVLADPNSDVNIQASNRAIEELFLAKPPTRVMQFASLRESESAIVRWLATLTFPFVKTPWNIGAQGLRKSPLGLGLLAYRMATDADFRADRDRAARHVAEQVLAYGTLAVLYAMTKGDDEPTVTGSRPPKAAAQSTFEQDNAPFQSLKIGGRWLSYAALEPYANPLTIIADGLKAMDKAKHGAEGAKVVGDMYNTTLSLVRDKTFLQTLGNIIDGVQDARGVTDAAANIATGVTGSLVPSIMRSAFRAGDPMIRDTRDYTKGPEGYAENLMRQTAYKWGAVDMNQPRVDLWGKEMGKETMANDKGWTAWTYRFLSPFYMRQVTDMDPADRLLWNYYTTNPNEAWPPMPDPDGQYRGKKTHMDAEQFHAFSVESGQRAKHIVDRLIQRGRLNPENPTARDIDIVKQVLSDVRQATRAKMNGKMSTGKE